MPSGKTNIIFIHPIV